MSTISVQITKEDSGHRPTPADSGPRSAGRVVLPRILMRLHPQPEYAGFVRARGGNGGLRVHDVTNGYKP